MKALVCSQLGDPINGIGLQIVRDHPSPEHELQARNVRIKVVAASINFADALQVQVSLSVLSDQ